MHGIKPNTLEPSRKMQGRKFCWKYGALRRNRFPEMSMEICCSREAARGVSPRSHLDLGADVRNSVGNMVPSEEKRICGSRSPDPSSPKQPKSTMAESTGPEHRAENLPGTDEHPPQDTIPSMCPSAARHGGCCVTGHGF